jgi:hypothetical protein
MQALLFRSCRSFQPPARELAISVPLGRSVKFNQAKAGLAYELVCVSAASSADLIKSDEARLSLWPSLMKTSYTINSAAAFLSSDLASARRAVFGLLLNEDFGQCSLQAAANGSCAKTAARFFKI